MKTGLIPAGVSLSPMERMAAAGWKGELDMCISSSVRTRAPCPRHERWRIGYWLLSLLGVLAVPPTALPQEASFMGMEPNRGASAVSADGTTIVGNAGTSGLNMAYRWTQTTGFIFLGTLPGTIGSAATGVSADGSVIVGSAIQPDITHRAFRWTPEGGMVYLGALPASTYSRAYAVSADGSTIVGKSGPNQNTSFVWTAETGMIAIGAGSAEAVSADGSVVVGMAGGHAYRWTAFTGLQMLGELPGYTHSYAYAVSADGRVIVGQLSGYRDHPFLWTSDGMEDLGSIASARDLEAIGVSADGSVVVGASRSGAAWENGFIWTRQEGIQDLRVFLLRQGVDAVLGWGALNANAMTPDASVIVGSGEGPCGGQAWVARLSGPPLPAYSYCYANCDCSTTAPVLNVNDFSCFLSRFTRREWRADCNGSGELNVDDFLCFMTRFVEGCN